LRKINGNGKTIIILMIMHCWWSSHQKHWNAKTLKYEVVQRTV
jgi:hypothetical protein